MPVDRGTQGKKCATDILDCEGDWAGTPKSHEHPLKCSSHRRKHVGVPIPSRVRLGIRRVRSRARVLSRGFEGTAPTVHIEDDIVENVEQVIFALGPPRAAVLALCRNRPNRRADDAGHDNPGYRNCFAHPQAYYIALFDDAVT